MAADAAGIVKVPPDLLAAADGRLAAAFLSYVPAGVADELVDRVEIRAIGGSADPRADTKGVDGGPFCSMTRWMLNSSNPPLA